MKRIDRLEWTKQHSPLLNSKKEPQKEAHGNICPRCGERSLFKMEGCETCRSCGYSACGLDR